MSSLHYYWKSHMQVVELVGVILALSMEVLEGVIPAQPLKAISGEKTAQPGSHGFVTARKLHCLAGPMHSGLSALAERPRDINKEAGGQRPVDAENRRSKSKRSKRSGPESESRSPRPRGQNLSWRINKWENPIVFLIAFSLPTNETYLLT